MQRFRVLTFIFCFCGIQFLGAQVSLNNPSFEDEPQDATVPMGWFPCEMGSTPDILPGFWGVYNESSDGETYIGLITRDDGTWENLGQRLSEPLEKGECYRFSLDLAHSKTYANYNLPVRLRIWGGQTRCDKAQLLGDTKAIQHEDWETYQFKFNAKKKFNYIIFEAYFMKGLFMKYKGNILIDNCSQFIPCERA